MSCFRICFLLAFLMGLLATASERPNVVLVVTDDQGYGDLSCHGNPVIQTPNVDRLYEESVRFTDFHVDPTCSPTRGALLTGKYSHHVRVWQTVCGGNHLRASEVTMADAFKQAGYRTGLFGKWHLGSNYPYRPMDRGFDEWLGHGDGGTGTTDDWFDNDRVNDHYWHNGERVQKDGFAPDVFFETAMEFIDYSVKKEEPFFVYIATYLPHSPHTLPDPSLAEKYQSQISDYVAYFFAGIDCIDSNIGRLRQKLEETGQADNTIFIFMTDNGGTAGVKLFNAGMRGNKGSVYEGGHRVPFFIHWPNGNLDNGCDVEDLSAHIDVFPTLVDLCDLSLDSVLDFDGRSFKKQLYEPELDLPERTLFVETQRTFKSKKWFKTAGMKGRWRFVDNSELYDLSKDPGQQNNVFNEYPEIVERIRRAHDEYWDRVTPGDRELPHFVVGHPDDEETFLTTSDWYLPKEPPWNHAMLASGSPVVGSWNITVASDGIYRFELSRWPREADAAISGIPDFSRKQTDSWLSSGAVDRLIYGSKMTALSIQKVELQIGEQRLEKSVFKDDKSVVFELKLKKGSFEVTGKMLGEAGELIAGAYYVYITKE